MNFALFEGLTAFFSKENSSFIIKIWQVYGGKLTFVPEYKKPDIWFGRDRRLIKKKKALRVRWIYDSILFHKCQPFDDYYVINRKKYISSKRSLLKKELKREHLKDSQEYKIHKLNETKHKTSLDDSNDSSFQKKMDTDISVALPLTPIRCMTFNNTTTIKNNIRSVSSTFSEKVHYVSSTPDKDLNLLSTPYQKTENIPLDKSTAYQSLPSLTKSTSSTSSLFEISNSPIEKIKVIALEDLETAVNVFEVVAAEKVHDKNGILQLRLK